MAFSISSITGLFKRGKKAQDPFGADDEDFYDDDVFDDEAEGGTLGRKIAIGMSAFMGLLLVGFITTAIMTADETAGPVVGALPTEIAQVVSEDGEVLQDLTAQIEPENPSAPGGAISMPPLSDDAGPTPMPMPGPGTGVAMPSTEIVSDSTTETDRSAARRPWLNSGNNTVEAPIPGTPSRASSMDDLLQRSRESAPTVTPPPAAPMEPETTQTAMPNEADPAEMDERPMTIAETANMAPAVPEEEPAPPAPTLADPGLVPGAPDRFAQDASADSGPTQVGGAPRLVEPELPPTDSRAISAAPPRFTTLPKAEQLTQSPAGAARVAIIVEGLGLNKTATEAAIDALPPGVTLAFSPYARDLEGWLNRAQEAGHEVLVEVPMESKRFPAEDPGPLGLLTSLDQIENVERLSAILEQAPGTAGVLDVSGSRFRESAEHINILMNNLDARGLFYVQGRPGLRLGNNRVASATTDMVLDERAFRASIDARLDYVERLARYQGSSVAVASAKPVTFERLALWLDEIGARGVAVAPVSEVLIQ